MLINKRSLQTFVFGSLLFATTAHATTFVVQIGNNSDEDWTQGLLTTTQLFDVGTAPGATSPYYPTYLYASPTCDVSDAFCPAGTCDDDGNAAVLAARMGLTIGVNAWIIPPIAHRDLVGFTQVFQATPPQDVYYVAAIVGHDDDIIAMHTYNDRFSPRMQIFDPVTHLPIDLFRYGTSGWDLNSSSSTDGNTPSCPQSCPPDPRCFVAYRARPGEGEVDPRPGLTLLSTYVQAEGKGTDGLTQVDVQPGGAQEILVTVNGGQYVTPPFTVANGGVDILLQSNLSLRTALRASNNHEVLGFPTAELITPIPSPIFFGDSTRISPPAPDVPAQEYSKAFNPATGTFIQNWSSTPYGYPSFWNMGATTGDVRTDAANPGREVIIGDLNGHIAVLNMTTGLTLNTYDLGTTQGGETLYGHLTVGNVDGLAGNEIIAYGQRNRRLYVFAAPNTNNTPLTNIWVSDQLPSPGGAFGSGPAIGNIDSDAHTEIVVTGGALSAVYAFDVQNGTRCKHQWTHLSGHGYYWSSPVIGDMTGTTQPEIAVFSSDSVLSILRANPPVAGTCVEGQVVWEYTVGNGGPANFVPVLGNIVGSTKLDVIVANYQTLEGIDVDAQRPELRHSEVTADFYPSAVLQAGPGGGNPSAFIYVSGWSNHTVYRIATAINQPIPVAWPAMMGNNQHTGAR